MSPEIIPEFDAVHDLQAGFRGVLEAFSFPGRLVDLSAPAGRLVPWIGGENATLALVAAALIDTDTTWASADSCPLTQFLVEWGSIKAGPAETAAFLVLPRFEDGTLAGVLSQAQIGTLADPHLGATVLVGVDDLEAGQIWQLRGPGIEMVTARILPQGLGWVSVRNDRVAEFPLGLDLVFCDRRGRVLALPRTTRMEV